MGKDMYRRKRRMMQEKVNDQSRSTSPPQPPPMAKPRLGGLRRRYKRKLKLERFHDKLAKHIKALHKEEGEGNS